MDNLKVTLVQAILHWEDKESNFKNFESLISSIVDTDLIVLPEMFTTGFSMQPQNHFEKSQGEGLQWMQRMASQTNAAICGSIIVESEGLFYNRFYFVYPDGDYKHYDKKHLFSFAGEEKVYTAGNAHLEVSYKGWKINPFVCYDLRFPVWCRNKNESHIMLFVANWPERRSEAWKSLLKARAIENMCYVVGVNRVGNDNNDIAHCGNSSIYDELGQLISDIPENEVSVKTFELSKTKVEKSRERFGFLNDKDSFEMI